METAGQGCSRDCEIAPAGLPANGEQGNGRGWARSCPECGIRRTRRHERLASGGVCGPGWGAVRPLGQAGPAWCRPSAAPRHGGRFLGTPVGVLCEPPSRAARYMVPPIGGTVYGASFWRHGVPPPDPAAVMSRRAEWCRRSATRFRPAAKAGGSCRPANRPGGFTAGQAIA